MTVQSRFHILFVFLLFFSVPFSGFAQGGTGILQGRVFDPSGAMIPQAQITVTSSSGKSTNAVADAAGQFTVRGLDPGIYTVNAATAGAKGVTANWTYEFVAVDPPASAHDGKVQIIGGTGSPTYGKPY